MTAPTQATQLIPRIWADALLSRLNTGFVLGAQADASLREEHERLMATDPGYAKAYELRMAEREAESYWDAFFENWFPSTEEDDDEW
jgi:hypothetical protein